MATKKSVAGDRLGYVYTGGSLIKQPLILTATTATITGAGGVVKNIAIITVTPGNGSLIYVAVSREFLQAQKDNKTNDTAGGKQLLLDAKYATADINKFATTAELTALSIVPWTDAGTLTATDFSAAGVATAKLGYDKYNHGTEIVGFDYADTTEDDKAKLTAETEAEAAAKKKKMYLIILAVVIALVLIFGFSTDWKFSFKKDEEVKEESSKSKKDKKD